jgi:streptomycin 6-kinase
MQDTKYISKKQTFGAFNIGPDIEPRALMRQRKRTQKVTSECVANRLALARTEFLSWSLASQTLSSCWFPGHGILGPPSFSLWESSFRWFT